MIIPVLHEHSTKDVVGALDDDGTMRFAEGVPEDWLPHGIGYEILESHEEGGVRHVDEIRVFELSVSPLYDS